MCSATSNAISTLYGRPNPYVARQGICTDVRSTSSTEHLAEAKVVINKSATPLPTEGSTPGKVAQRHAGPPNKVGSLPRITHGFLTNPESLNSVIDKGGTK